jgi:L-ascorbate metabolism protein UlaG (beta-lactamase superfamily)
MDKNHKIIFAFFVIFTSIAIYSCTNLLAPSANLKDYNAYFTSDTNSVIPPGAVRVTFFGTTSLLFDDGETQIMIDGFFTRPSFLKVGLCKLKTDTNLINKVIKSQKINRLKGIFASHSHYDHVMDAAYLAKVTKAILYGSSSTLNVGRGEGLSEDQMSQFNTEKEIRIGKFSVFIIKAKHSPQPKKIDSAGQEITHSIKQPAKMKEFKEGGSFDILIKHEGHSILVKSSCNYVDKALDSVKVNVFFMGITGLVKKDSCFQNNLYKQTVEKISPSLIIPIHWDNFFKPLSKNLKAFPNFMNNTKANLDYIIKRAKADKIEVKILQCYKSVLLFTETNKQE